MQNLLTYSNYKINFKHKIDISKNSWHDSTKKRVSVAEKGAGLKHLFIERESRRLLDKVMQ